MINTAKKRIINKNASTSKGAASPACAMKRATGCDSTPQLGRGVVE
jgi:hypothetical protein